MEQDIVDTTLDNAEKAALVGHTSPFQPASDQVPISEALVDDGSELVDCLADNAIQTTTQTPFVPCSDTIHDEVYHVL